jgi:hypothetical protein
MAEIDRRLAGIDCLSASRRVVEEHQAPRRCAPGHTSANAVRNLRTIRAAFASTSPAAGSASKLRIEDRTAISQTSLTSGETILMWTAAGMVAVD